MCEVQRATSQSFTSGAMTGASDATSRRRCSRSVLSSGSVVGIDLDIPVREVARPDPRAALPYADVDRDADVLPLDMGGDRRLVIVRATLALFRDHDPADLDAELVAVGFLAGLPHSHDDAAPVCILAGDRGLHQGRVGDGEADAPCGARGGGAG